MIIIFFSFLSRFSFQIKYSNVFQLEKLVFYLATISATELSAVKPVVFHLVDGKICVCFETNTFLCAKVFLQIAGKIFSFFQTCLIVENVTSTHVTFSTTMLDGIYQSIRVVRKMSKTYSPVDCT